MMNTENKTRTKEINVSTSTLVSGRYSLASEVTKTVYPIQLLLHVIRLC